VRITPSRLQSFINRFFETAKASEHDEGIKIFASSLYDCLQGKLRQCDDASVKSLCTAITAVFPDVAETTPVGE